MPTLIYSPWGGKDNNCYVGLTEADSYLNSLKLDLTPWSSAATAQREKALLIATQRIDNAFPWIGDRVYFDQALNFPRVPSGDERWPWTQMAFTAVSTWTIYLNEQKRRVEQATCEEAFAILRDGERNEHLERRLAGLVSYSESYGPISEGGAYGNTQLGLTPEALKLLLPYKGVPVVVRG